MLFKIEINDNKCHFEQCRHYEAGECLSEEARRDCLEIASAVLCLDKEPEIEERLRKCVQDSNSID